jgi:CPA1 family monovalent cation:H+ antiporter
MPPRRRWPGDGSDVEGLLLIAVLGVTVLIGTTIGGRYRVAPPVLLIALGTLIGFLPPFQHLSLPPDVVLVLFLPPILYRESIVLSVREVRANFGAITLLAVLLVVISTAAVSYTAQALGVAPKAAWVLGAVLGPTDAAAVAGLAKRMPRGILTTLRTESLVNDGTALVIFSVAVAVVAGGAVPGPLGLLTGFVGSAAVGVGAGLLVGLVVIQIRRHIDDALVEGGLSILTPVGAFLLAQPLHGSGVLGVVVAGLLLSYANPRVIRARSRILALSFWDLFTFMLNGSLFVLLGTQVPRSLRGITGHRPSQALAIAVVIGGVVVLVRLLGLYVVVGGVQAIDRRPSRRGRRFSVGELTVAGWAGFRGAVSLAAALAVPLVTISGAPVADRDLIIFITVIVIVLIMLVQGTTLPLLTSWAGLSGDPEREDEVRRARIRATEAGLRALARVASDVGASDDAVERLRSEYQEHLDESQAPDDKEANREREMARQLRLRVLDVKRREVIRLRDANEIDDSALQEVQSALDIEEVRLLGPRSVD